MIGVLKQREAGRKAEDVEREVGVSKHTIYAWKAMYGGLEVSWAAAQTATTASGAAPGVVDAGHELCFSVSG
jgi:Transposase